MNVFTFFSIFSTFSWTALRWLCLAITFLESMIMIDLSLTPMAYKSIVEAPFIILTIFSTFLIGLTSNSSLSYLQIWLQLFTKFCSSSIKFKYNPNFVISIDSWSHRMCLPLDNDDLPTGLVLALEYFVSNSFLLFSMSAMCLSFLNTTCFRESTCTSYSNKKQFQVLNSSYFMLSFNMVLARFSSVHYVFYCGDDTLEAIHFTFYFSKSKFFPFNSITWSLYISLSLCTVCFYSWRDINS